MSELEELGGFFRKGKIASWRDRFTPEQSARFDRIYAERMAGTGLSLRLQSLARVPPP